MQGDYKKALKLSGTCLLIKKLFMIRNHVFLSPTSYMVQIPDFQIEAQSVKSPLTDAWDCSGLLIVYRFFCLFVFQISSVLGV